METLHVLEGREATASLLQSAHLCFQPDSVQTRRSDIPFVERLSPHLDPIAELPCTCRGAAGRRRPWLSVGPVSTRDASRVRSIVRSSLHDLDRLQALLDAQPLAHALRVGHGDTWGSRGQCLLEPHGAAFTQMQGTSMPCARVLFFRQPRCVRSTACRLAGSRRDCNPPIPT